MSRVWKVAITEALANHDALRKELIQAQVETELARKETTDVAASLEADLAARDERITALDPGWHFYWVHHHNFGHFV